MRRALAKRLIPLLMVLVLVIPYFAVSYYDVYGDDKQNLNDANSKKKDLQSQYEQTEKIIEDLKAQRLSIARALLRHSPILLLDEATSALDVATERKVLKNIMQDTYPRTCIVTTHRPTVLNICTRVYAIREKKCEVLKDEEIEKLMGDF